MVAGVELPDGRALTSSAPQARHHFTRLDQIDQLVEASEADAELGFMARLLALCSLPRTNPGDRLQFKRANGPYKLIMTATGDAKLPYGTLPRLLLVWVCTEAVRTQNRELVLGRSLYEFMQKLGILSSDSGGVTGIRTRLRNQMQRLFGCTVSLLYEDARVATTMNAPIARRTEFWWRDRQPDTLSLWESKIELGEDFFNEIVSHPIPLDMNILRSLKRSALGLDLYLWLTYRTFALKRPLRLTWPLLYRQFGVDPAKAGDTKHREQFPQRLSPRVAEDQARVAGPALSDGQGRVATLPLPAAHRAVEPAARGIALHMSVTVHYIDGDPVTYAAATSAHLDSSGLMRLVEMEQKKTATRRCERPQCEAHHPGRSYAERGPLSRKCSGWGSDR